MRRSVAPAALALMLSGCSAAIGQDDLLTNDFTAPDNVILEELTAADQPAGDNAKLSVPRAQSYQLRRDQFIEEMRKLERTPKPPSVSLVIARALATFRGKPQSYAFRRIGYPDSKMTIGREIIYSWINTTPTGYGSPGTLRCVLKVVTRGGIISTTDFNGNAGACERFAFALDPSFKGIGWR